MDYKILKRFIDISFAGGLVIVFFPLLLTIYLLILILDKQNPVFKQRRPGLDGKAFSMYKFRTMRSNEELTVELEKITGLGTFLRNYSLDELPQLVNVLQGTMSLVGPRPLLMSYLPLYTKEQMARHLVKPGMTGLAQVSGRNSLDWDAKFHFDLEYVRTLSLSTDLKIMFKTLNVIGELKNVNASNTITVQPFTPTQNPIKC